MITKYDAKYRTYGYGETEEEALDEMNFNILRDDIKRDTTGKWLSKINEHHCWNPLPNVIHMDRVCAVRHEKDVLVNTKSNNVCYFDDTPLCHYKTLFTVLNGDVDFKTFNLVYGENIDKFLSCTNAGQLKDFPITKPATLSFVKCMHSIGEVGFVAETPMDNIIVVSDWKKMYEIEVPHKVPLDNIIAYGFAKLGLLYDGKSLKKI